VFSWLNLPEAPASRRCERLSPLARLTQ